MTRPGSNLLIGCIADDMTGATDVALSFARAGLHTVQLIGVPARHGLEGTGSAPLDEIEADVVVVALKSRSNPPEEAIEQSLASADYLIERGAEQIFFKYCSTFDSTDRGNIGPVTEALMERLGCDLTIACPSFPTTGRTVYRGYMFVGECLLSESPLKDHPLNPMHDPNLIRVLGRQTTVPVGLLPIETIVAGRASVEAHLTERRDAGDRILVVDSVTDGDLAIIGEAVESMRLVTGASGLAFGMANTYLARRIADRKETAAPFRASDGRAVIIAGSCSAATREQVERYVATGAPVRQVDTGRLAENAEREVAAMLAWALDQAHTRAPLLYSTADPEQVERVQARLGVEDAGRMIERGFASLARSLVDAGFTRLVVAGGETSGAVVGALDVQALEIGPEIDPGVPWTRAIGGKPLTLALKSGNFGAPDFFAKALAMLT